MRERQFGVVWIWIVGKKVLRQLGEVSAAYLAQKEGFRRLEVVWSLKLVTWKNFDTWLQFAKHFCYWIWDGLEFMIQRSFSINFSGLATTPASWFLSQSTIIRKKTHSLTSKTYKNLQKPIWNFQIASKTVNHLSRLVLESTTQLIIAKYWFVN